MFDIVLNVFWKKEKILKEMFFENWAKRQFLSSRL